MKISPPETVLEAGDSLGALPPASEFASTDDDPSRLKDFFEFKKVMLEMKTSKSSVGSIVGAMVYQIGQMKEQRHEAAIKDGKPKTPEEVKKAKKLSNKRSTMSLVSDPKEDEISALFEGLMDNLTIEHAI